MALLHVGTIQEVCSFLTALRVARPGIETR